MDTGTGGIVEKERHRPMIEVKLTAIIAHTIYRKFITLVWQVDNVLIEAGSPI